MPLKARHLTVSWKTRKEQLLKLISLYWSLGSCKFITLSAILNTRDDCGVWILPLISSLSSLLYRYFWKVASDPTMINVAMIRILFGTTPACLFLTSDQVCLKKNNFNCYEITLNSMVLFFILNLSFFYIAFLLFIIFSSIIITPPTKNKQTPAIRLESNDIYTGPCGLELIFSLNTLKQRLNEKRLYTKTTKK